MKVVEAVENALRAEIINRWRSHFTASTWKKRPFSEYTHDPADAQAIVIYAVRSVAYDLDIHLPDEAEHYLRDCVNLLTTPEVTLLWINKTLEWSAQPEQEDDAQIA